MNFANRYQNVEAVLNVVALHADTTSLSLQSAIYGFKGKCMQKYMYVYV